MCCWRVTRDIPKGKLKFNGNENLHGVTGVLRSFAGVMSTVEEITKALMNIAFVGRLI